MAGFGIKRPLLADSQNVGSRREQTSARVLERLFGMARFEPVAECWLSDHSPEEADVDSS